jgi:hypothetical protein
MGPSLFTHCASFTTTMVERGEAVMDEDVDMLAVEMR